MHCLNPACNALLPFEVEADATLLLDLRDCARRLGNTWYFPCPSCGGKNFLELPSEGQGKPRVVRFESGRVPQAAQTNARGRTEEPLTWIPDDVRKKLDRAGVKLHLAQWQRLPLAERARLLELPCQTDEEAALYRTYLQNVLRRSDAGPLESLVTAGDARDVYNR